MVGGRLRCLGSLTQLKAKFGDGYQQDLKLAQPSDRQMAEIARPLAQVAPDGMIRPATLDQACGVLGDRSRKELIAEDNPAGVAVWHVLNANGAVPVVEFAQWWIIQDLSARLADFMRDEFPGSVSPTSLSLARSLSRARALSLLLHQQPLADGLSRLAFCFFRR